LTSVRLLPVVIFAALALLVFKGIGLVTEGGYVLTGTTEALAAGGEAPAQEATTADMGGTPEEVVIEDTSPTMEDDGAPTMKTNQAAAADHGAPAAEESHGSEAEAETSSDAGHETTSEGEHAESSVEVAAVVCPTVDPAVPAVDSHGEPIVVPPECLPSEVPTNEHGDALPLIKDGEGKIVPLESEGDASEQALLARLSERRVELDTREADIAMRLVLLEAAEKKLDERARELAALEARVAELVDEKQAAEEAGFKAVVSMYEAMKPKDAAKIFDTLKLSVLLKVARSMSPRKMSPILAAMAAEPAQQLTTALAATESTDVVAKVGENLAALPQIVGQ
jgi:flagellar motility protein MotE (MotC chaperone)